MDWILKDSRLLEQRVPKEDKVVVRLLSGYLEELERAGRSHQPAFHQRGMQDGDLEGP